MTVGAECFGGPEDGRTVTVPADCQELRFPLLNAGLRPIASDKVEPERMSCAVYLKGVRVNGKLLFVYHGVR